MSTFLIPVLNEYISTTISFSGLGRFGTARSPIERDQNVTQGHTIFTGDARHF